MLTLPASAAVGALTYGVVRCSANGDAGPIVVSAVLLALLACALGRRLVAGRTLTADGVRP